MVKRKYQEPEMVIGIFEIEENVLTSGMGQGGVDNWQDGIDRDELLKPITP